MKKIIFVLAVMLIIPLPVFVFASETEYVDVASTNTEFTFDVVFSNNNSYF